MDAIDRVVSQWAKEKPDLDTEPMAIMGRLMRIAKYMENRVAEVHKRYDLKMGEFDVLATLRRSGEPYRLTPSELISSMMLTSGAMTNRLDKLEKKGLIAREHSKEDRRSVSVQLTSKGFELIDALIEQHLQAQHELMGSLTRDEREQVNQALKLLLPQYE
ncbi:MarR family winged helix-turn-helix transcriptional regulator [Vibrio harveyi]|jgi:DNA-binding MarR family transcriptional regulator|uniref:MarR family winged helix-turn-helix transcriptional regulator n=1 Tax=Vibrio harveyi TaxID=669 RepID=UPI0006806034|nr:MarR family transcriptional regulator [Vibrio harveyi]EMB9230433.1 MarR family transcriptional regulator [Vibrio harveyi]CAH1529922.1 Transcriptional regulator, MarR family [Vibrio harveyi]CAK6715355.1 Transcriptional regulator, MarR family [Vibrio harveyi]GBL00693.1 MarR family transcriptional regulator [Vibrio harveyi]HDM8071546.1 MarR family transcriptional regulator [Vibrio harveyi]